MTSTQQPLASDKPCFLARVAMAVHQMLMLFRSYVASKGLAGLRVPGDPVEGEATWSRIDQSAGKCSLGEVQDVGSRCRFNQAKGILHRAGLTKAISTSRKPSIWLGSNSDLKGTVGICGDTFIGKTVLALHTPWNATLLQDAKLLDYQKGTTFFLARNRMSLGIITLNRSGN